MVVNEYWHSGYVSVINIAFKKLGRTPTPELKSDIDSWICVIVTAYWVNDADRQIRKIFLHIIIPYYYEVI